MTKITPLIALFTLFVLCSLRGQNTTSLKPVFKDLLFTQNFSVKYNFKEEGTKLEKVYSDRNGVIQVLTSKGLYKPYAGAFLYPGTLVPDGSFRPMGDKKIAGIEDRAVKAMQHYPWPGNIREMQNVIERCAVLAKDGVIRLENLPTVFTTTLDSCLDIDVKRRRVSFKAERELQVVRTEKHIIARYLDESDGNVAKAARLANVPRRTFYRLLEKHGIVVVRRAKTIS